MDIVPGFLLRMADRYPVYSIPDEDRRWIEASPERNNALFSEANTRCGAKPRSISRLIKTWQFARSPPLRISAFYVDMLLATSEIAWGVKSYGQCLSDLFSELLRREMRGLLDPAGASSVIVANSSSAVIEQLCFAVKDAGKQAQFALEAQTRGENAEANRRWKVLFKRAL